MGLAEYKVLYADPQSEREGSPTSASNWRVKKAKNCEDVGKLNKIAPANAELYRILKVTFREYKHYFPQLMKYLYKLTMVQLHSKSR